jgi:hypothetical protein
MDSAALYKIINQEPVLIDDGAVKLKWSLNVMIAVEESIKRDIASGLYDSEIFNRIYIFFKTILDHKDSKYLIPKSVST